MDQQYTSFSEFYPYYLSEHSNRMCRRLHFIGTSCVIACVITAFITGDAEWLIAAPLAAYGCAWIGHYGFEKNRPATFRYPFYSFMGDWVMFKDMLAGRITF